MFAFFIISYLGILYILFYIYCITLSFNLRLSCYIHFSPIITIIIYYISIITIFYNLHQTLLLSFNKNIIKYSCLANSFIKLIFLFIFSHNNNCFIIILPIVIVLYFVQIHFNIRQTTCFLLTRIKVLSSNLSLTVNDFISIWLPHGY